MMSIIKFESMHPDVLTAVGASGWLPGRRVDVESWITLLEGEGYRVSSIAGEVLSALGGLVVEPTNSSGPNFSNDEPFVFDPISAGSGQLELAQEVEGILGGNYFPIGEWLSYSSVFIEDGGRMVAAGMGWIWELGKTFEEGLELAIRAHRPLICLYSDPGLDPWPKPAPN
ncbi:SUKH-3 domain-containing protein [Nonomuraea wenchangensis]